MCESSLIIHILTKFYDDDVIETKIMAILSPGVFRFSVFPTEINTKKRKLLYVRFGGQLFQQTVGIPMGTTVPYYWLTCFSIPKKTIFQIRRAKERLLQCSASHIVTLMALSLSIIKDFRNSPLIFTPKELTISETTNLLQLLLISTFFLPEIRTTTKPPNYMTNVMRLVSTP